ncbi:MAG: ABC transporter ATP-binding protein [Verrucomicrobia bacterium]|jgi:putative ABC transport system ATP-binding protein|nr:ABC transporter ATP-binding protein [Verrucomicrobiota bacterium]
MRLPWHVEAWYDAMASTDKLGSIVDLDIEKETGQSFEVEEGSLTVCIENLHFAFDPKQPIFTGFNLEVKGGEVLGLTGPVGAGAGTLLELLYGLRPIEEGEVFLSGRDLRHVDLTGLRSRVVLIRDIELFEGTLLENLRLGNEAISLEQVYQILKDVGLYNKVRQMPKGVETHLQIGGRPFSGSERIKLCIVRALLVRPGLLLIDKLLDGLDPEESSSLFSSLFQSDSNMTLMVSTRDREILNRCSRVVRIMPEIEHASKSSGEESI